LESKGRIQRQTSQSMTVKINPSPYTLAEEDELSEEKLDEEKLDESDMDDEDTESDEEIE